jgi:hypothetical protein
MRCLNASIFSEVSVNEHNISRSRIRSRLSSIISLTSMPYSSKKIKNAIALIPEEISNEARFSHVVGNYGGLNFR